MVHIIHAECFSLKEKENTRIPKLQPCNCKLATNKRREGTFPVMLSSIMKVEYRVLERGDSRRSRESLGLSRVTALRLRAKKDRVGVMSLSTMRLSHGLRRRLRAGRHKRVLLVPGCPPPPTHTLQTPLNQTLHHHQVQPPFPSHSLTTLQHSFSSPNTNRPLSDHTLSNCTNLTLTTQRQSQTSLQLYIMMWRNLEVFHLQLHVINTTLPITHINKLLLLSRLLTITKHTT